MAMEMEERLFTNCKLTISKKVATNNLKLFTLITDQLLFKIIGCDPLVIEKDSPSQQDIDYLFGALKEFLVVQDADASVFVSDPGKNIENRGIEENLMIRSSIQTSRRKAPEVGKQLTKDVRKKDNGDFFTDKLPSQQNSSTDGNIHHLTNIIKNIRANNVTQDQHLVEKLRDQKNQSCVENVSSVEKILTKHKSYQAAQLKTTYPIITSVQSLQKENDTNPFKENIKTTMQTKETNINDDNPFSKSMITEKNKPEMERNSIRNYRQCRRINQIELLRSFIIATQPAKSAYNHDGSISSLPDTRSLDLKRSDNSMPASGARGYDTYSKAQNDNFIVTDRSNMEVKVYKADITKLQVDCIVNATNSQLCLSGGVSKFIAEAAGPSLTKECKDFIKDGNNVAVTNIFVSTGGRLPAKHVIHTVGPKWDYYDDKSKCQCLCDLRQTILRCLVEASRRGMASIALPSVSAAVCKVPKEECAMCYMKAVKHFDVISDEEKFSLCEIHFVDVDDTMVNLIRECFTTSFDREIDKEILQKDREFVRGHHYSASRNETSNQPKKSGYENTFSAHCKPGTFSGRTTRTPEVSETYKIGNISLTIDIKPAFDHPSDTIITIGKPFDKLSGLHDYSVQYTTKQHKQNIFEIVSVSKPGSKASRLVLAVDPEPDDSDKMKDAFKNLETAIENFDQKLTRLILTSSILYSEPNNQHQKGKKRSDPKMIEKFAQWLIDYLGKLKSPNNISSVVVVVGSGDAMPTIKRVLESCNCKIVPGGFGTLGGPQVTCRICFANKPCRPVLCCCKALCQDCEQRLTLCPFCRTIWKPIIGNQPRGSMSVCMTSDHCSGYESFPTWKIAYFLPAGVQQECHPNPGKSYNLTLRIAFLPANEKGLRVLVLLRLAFIRKLTFTIGHSATTNRDDVIVWNDIHHKTSIDGEPYGYPDPGYLNRIESELASKGVVMETMTVPEQDQINNFRSCISTTKSFTEK